MGGLPKRGRRDPEVPDRKVGKPVLGPGRFCGALTRAGPSGGGAIGNDGKRTLRRRWPDTPRPCGSEGQEGGEDAMNCPGCGVPAVIMRSGTEVTGDRSPDTQTEVWSVLEYHCRNPQCIKCGEDIGETRHRIYPQSTDLKGGEYGE